MDETMMTEPAPRAAISGIAIWHSQRFDRTLEFMMRS